MKNIETILYICFIALFIYSFCSFHLLYCTVGLQSYKRSADAWASGVFQPEVVEVTILGKRGKPNTVVTEDEEYKKVNFDKFRKLATVFQVC